MVRSETNRACPKATFLKWWRRTNPWPTSGRGNPHHLVRVRGGWTQTPMAPEPSSAARCCSAPGEHGRAAPACWRSRRPRLDTGARPTCPRCTTSQSTANMDAPLPPAQRPTTRSGLGSSPRTGPGGADRGQYAQVMVSYHKSSCYGGPPPPPPMTSATDWHPKIIGDHSHWEIVRWRWKRAE